MVLTLGTDLNGWPPENQAFPIDAIDIRVEDSPLPQLDQFEPAISANWNAEVGANPHLFNGKLLTITELAIDNNVIRANARIIPYAYHLWWRRQSSPPPTFHAFAMAVLVAGDNSVIAIRMSRTTANAGKVYCASGSLELDDVIDGRVDIDANMRREVAEETGLDLDHLTAGHSYYCAHFRKCIMFYRFYRSDLPASALIERVHEHMRHDREKEIDGVVAITPENRCRFDYGYSMPPALDLFFNASARKSESIFGKNDARIQ